MVMALGKFILGRENLRLDGDFDVFAERNDSWSAE